MELQNFNSLFEIFATFTLAYVLIDELTENPFISLISEKILRKGKRVDEIYSNISNKISGFKTSINNIPALCHNDPKVEDGIPRMNKLLATVEERYNQYFLELRSLIRKNYSTKVFVFLNSYLFLYCLAVLYLSGLYTDTNDGVHNNCLNNSLLILDTGTIAVLVFGWFVDKKKATSSKANRNTLNGYKCMGIAFIVTALIAIVCYYLHWSILPESVIVNNIIIQITIFLPVSNFLVYFFIAAKRLNDTVPQLLEKAIAYESSFNTDVKKVVNFLAMCEYVGEDDILVLDSGSEIKT